MNAHQDGFVVNNRFTVGIKFADAAFALKVDDVSAPVQGRFGTVLVQTVKIEGATQRPYESVADTIKRRLAEDKARSAMGELRDKIEDERAAGDPAARSRAASSS